MNVIFDFANTLAELRPFNHELLQQYIYQITGLQIDNKTIQSAYLNLDAILPYSSVSIRTRSDRIDFFNAYNHNLLVLLGARHLINPKDIYLLFSETKRHWAPKQGIEQYIADLFESGHRLYILSNFDSNLESVVHSHCARVHKCFTSIISSQQCELEKPNPQFYNYFLEKEHLSIRDCIYIGDNYYLDYLPCQQIGLKSYIIPPNYDNLRHLPFTFRSMGDLLFSLPELNQ